MKLGGNRYRCSKYQDLFVENQKEVIVLMGRYHQKMPNPRLQSLVEYKKINEDASAAAATNMAAHMWHLS